MKTGHKLIAAMLALLMIAGLMVSAPWAVEAHAAESTSIHLEVTHVNPLYADIVTEDDLVQPGPTLLLAGDDDITYLTKVKDAANVVREGMVNRDETIVVYYHMDDYTLEGAEALIEEIAATALEHTGVPTEGDYLRWQFGGWDATMNGNWDEDPITHLYVADVTITYTYTYYTSAVDEAEMNDAVDQILAELNVGTLSDYNKIHAIYEYICDNVVYDKSESEDTYKHTAHAALISEKAVCQGYALAFYRLALELDVDARLIAGQGNGQPHGWNIVQVGDVYYNLDSTWDAGKDSKAWEWFMLSNASFENHTRDTEYNTKAFNQTYPMSEDDSIPCPHDLVTGDIVEATCTADGVKPSTCQLCGHKFEEILTATGHDYDDGVVTKEPTCAATGVKTFTCSKCEGTKTQSIATVDHTYGAAVVIDPSCTAEGYTQHTCTVCGYMYTDTPTEKTAHVFDSGKVTTEATCTEDGVKTYTCTGTGCNKTKEEAVPATGHDFDEGTVTTPATCEEDGVLTHKCTNTGCDETKATSIAPTGHDYDEGKITTQPACTTEGVKTYTCATCEGTKTESIAATGHTYGAGVELKPTCNTQGYTQYTCTICNYQYADNYVTPLEHNFEDGICIDCGAKAVYRVYGSNRYATSFAIADSLKEELGVNQFSSIIIACGDNFADALSGSYLAAVKHAPILLTNGENTEDLIAYIQKNLGTGGTVYLLGGNVAVPETIEEDLEAAKLNVKRLSGKTRYDTNLAILEEAGVGNQEILVCTGTSYADSLSASATGKPILLVGESLTDAQKAFLETTSGKFFVIGGQGAVSSGVALGLQTYGEVERISGATRYETSILVAKQFFSNPTSAVLTYAQNFPDGLCGGPLAYVTGSPMILTATDHSDEAVKYTASMDITQGYVLGGSSLIADSTVRAIFNMEEDHRITVRS